MCLRWVEFCIYIYICTHKIRSVGEKISTIYVVGTWQYVNFECSLTSMDIHVYIRLPRDPRNFRAVNLVCTFTKRNEKRRATSQLVNRQQSDGGVKRQKWSVCPAVLSFGIPQSHNSVKYCPIKRTPFKTPVKN